MTVRALSEEKKPAQDSCGDGQLRSSKPRVSPVPVVREAPDVEERVDDAVTRSREILHSATQSVLDHRSQLLRHHQRVYARSLSSKDKSNSRVPSRQLSVTERSQSHDPRILTSLPPLPPHQSSSTESSNTEEATTEPEQIDARAAPEVSSTCVDGSSINVNRNKPSSQNSIDQNSGIVKRRTCIQKPDTNINDYFPPELIENSPAVGLLPTPEAAACITQSGYHVVRRPPFCKQGEKPSIMTIPTTPRGGGEMMTAAPCGATKVSRQAIKVNFYSVSTQMPEHGGCLTTKSKDIATEMSFVNIAAPERKVARHHDVATQSKTVRTYECSTQSKVVRLTDTSTQANVDIASLRAETGTQTSNDPKRDDDDCVKSPRLRDAKARKPSVVFASPEKNACSVYKAIRKSPLMYGQGDTLCGGGGQLQKQQAAVAASPADVPAGVPTGVPPPPSGYHVRRDCSPSQVSEVAADDIKMKATTKQQPSPGCEKTLTKLRRKPCSDGILARRLGSSVDPKEFGGNLPTAATQGRATIAASKKKVRSRDHPKPIMIIGKFNYNGGRSDDKATDKGKSAFGGEKGRKQTGIYNEQEGNNNESHSKQNNHYGKDMIDKNSYPLSSEAIDHCYKSQLDENETGCRSGVVDVEQSNNTSTSSSITYQEWTKSNAKLNFNSNSNVRPNNGVMDPNEALLHPHAYTIDTLQPDLDQNIEIVDPKAFYGETHAPSNYDYSTQMYGGQACHSLQPVPLTVDHSTIGFPKPVDHSMRGFSKPAGGLPNAGSCEVKEFRTTPEATPVAPIRPSTGPFVAQRLDTLMKLMSPPTNKTVPVIKSDLDPTSAPFFPRQYQKEVQSLVSEPPPPPPHKPVRQYQPPNIQRIAEPRLRQFQRETLTPPSLPSPPVVEISKESSDVISQSFIRNFKKAMKSNRSETFFISYGNKVNSTSRVPPTVSESQFSTPISSMSPRFGSSRASRKNSRNASLSNSVGGGKSGGFSDMAEKQVLRSSKHSTGAEVSSSEGSEILDNGCVNRWNNEVTSMSRTGTCGTIGTSDHTVWEKSDAMYGKDSGNKAAFAESQQVCESEKASDMESVGDLHNIEELDDVIESENVDGSGNVELGNVEDSRKDCALEHIDEPERDCQSGDEESEDDEGESEYGSDEVDSDDGESENSEEEYVESQEGELVNGCKLGEPDDRSDNIDNPNYVCEIDNIAEAKTTLNTTFTLNDDGDGVEQDAVCAAEDEKSTDGSNAGDFESATESAAENERNDPVTPANDDIVENIDDKNTEFSSSSFWDESPTINPHSKLPSKDTEIDREEVIVEEMEDFLDESLSTQEKLIEEQIDKDNHKEDVIVDEMGDFLDESLSTQARLIEEQIDKETEKEIVILEQTNEILDESPSIQTTILEEQTDAENHIGDEHSEQDELASNKEHREADDPHETVSAESLPSNSTAFESSSTDSVIEVQKEGAAAAAKKPPKSASPRRKRRSAAAKRSSCCCSDEKTASEKQAAEEASNSQVKQVVLDYLRGATEKKANPTRSRRSSISPHVKAQQLVTKKVKEWESNQVTKKASYSSDDNVDDKEEAPSRDHSVSPSDSCDAVVASSCEVVDSGVVVGDQAEAEKTKSSTEIEQQESSIDEGSALSSEKEVSNASAVTTTETPDNADDNNEANIPAVDQTSCDDTNKPPPCLEPHQKPEDTEVCMPESMISLQSGDVSFFSTQKQKDASAAAGQKSKICWRDSKAEAEKKRQRELEWTGVKQTAVSHPPGEHKSGGGVKTTLQKRKTKRYTIKKRAVSAAEKPKGSPIIKAPSPLHDGRDTRSVQFSEDVDIAGNTIEDATHESHSITDIPEEMLGEMVGETEVDEVEPRSEISMTTEERARFLIGVDGGEGEKEDIPHDASKTHIPVLVRKKAKSQDTLVKDARKRLQHLARYTQHAGKGGGLNTLRLLRAGRTGNMVEGSSVDMQDYVMTKKTLTPRILSKTGGHRSDGMEGRESSVDLVEHSQRSESPQQSPTASRNISNVSERRFSREGSVESAGTSRSRSPGRRTSVSPEKSQKTRSSKMLVTSKTSGQHSPSSSHVATRSSAVSPSRPGEFVEALTSKLQEQCCCGSLEQSHCGGGGAGGQGGQAGGPDAQGSSPVDVRRHPSPPAATLTKTRSSSSGKKLHLQHASSSSKEGAASGSCGSKKTSSSSSRSSKKPRRSASSELCKFPPTSQLTYSKSVPHWEKPKIKTAKKVAPKNKVTDIKYMHSRPQQRDGLADACCNVKPKSKSQFSPKRYINVEPRHEVDCGEMKSCSNIEVKRNLSGIFQTMKERLGFSLTPHDTQL